VTNEVAVIVGVLTVDLTAVSGVMATIVTALELVKVTC